MSCPRCERCGVELDNGSGEDAGGLWSCEVCARLWRKTAPKHSEGVGLALHPPLEISPRHLPGVRIGHDSWLAIEYSPRPGDEDRVRYRYFIDTPTFEFSGDDLQSASGTLQDGLESLLTFLIAAEKSSAYRQQTGRTTENEDLFPAQIIAWAHEHSEKLNLVLSQFGENSDLLAEKFRLSFLKLIARADGSTITFEDRNGQVRTLITKTTVETWVQPLNHYFDGDKPRLRRGSPEDFLRILFENSNSPSEHSQN